MGATLRNFPRLTLSSAPIVAVIAFFQLFVILQPLPELAVILFGLLLVVIGLTLVYPGLEMGRFPLGESKADAIARKGSLTALLAFSFCLGFRTTVAEPALITSPPSRAPSPKARRRAPTMR